MAGQIWTFEEEELYEEQARMGIPIETAIRVANNNKFGHRTIEEVDRHFKFRKKPWNIMMRSALGTD